MTGLKDCKSCQEKVLLSLAKKKTKKKTKKTGWKKITEVF